MDKVSINIFKNHKIWLELKIGFNKDKMANNSRTIVLWRVVPIAKSF